MKTWRIRLQPNSPWVTPWHADSLFGSICWRWSWLWPDSFLSILSRFSRIDDIPPFLISDAFIGDLLPLPLHTLLPSTGDQGSQGQKRKWKPPLYIQEKDFLRLSRNEDVTPLHVYSSQVQGNSRLQSAENRETGRSADGALFETACQFMPSVPSCQVKKDNLSETTPFEGREPYFTVYLRTENYLDQLMQCFRALAYTGFGKKSSSGLGAFSILGEPEPCSWLDEMPDANGFISLSHFVPSTTDPIDGWWRVQVSHPKFHANEVTGVFKGIIMRLTPGSSFRLLTPYRPWYGSMLPIPRPEMQQALHYALCFPVPFHIPLTTI
jgi:CRISPR-associated protein Csm4